MSLLVRTGTGVTGLVNLRIAAVCNHQMKYTKKNLSTSRRPSGASASASGLPLLTNLSSSIRIRTNANSGQCYYSSKSASSSSPTTEYKSSVSLDKLYPNSSLDISKPAKIPEEPDQTKFSGYIPINQIKISYSKSSGPGGQHVNTTCSKVEIRFHVESAEWIPQPVREIFLSKFRNVISKEGFFIITSDRTRSQHLNTADALEKLREMIHSAEPVAIEEPSPETLEKLRRQREKAARERLHQKRNRSDVKSYRGGATASLAE